MADAVGFLVELYPAHGHSTLGQLCEQRTERAVADVVPELDSVRTTPRQERHQRPERNDQNQGHHQGREANYVHPEAGGNTERRGQPQGRRSCDPGDVEPASHDCTGPDEADPARDLRSNARRVGDAIDAVRARDREQSGTDRDQGVGSNPGYLRL